MKKLFFLFKFCFLFIKIVFAQAPLVKQWDFRYGGSDADIITCSGKTSDGGYILGGYSYSGIGGDKTQDTVGNFDYWIVKVGTSGLKQWDRTYGGLDWDILTSIVQTTDGGYLLGGTSYSGLGGDKSQNNVDTIGYSADYWIVRIDSSGNFLWDKTLGGTNEDKLTSITCTNNNGFIIGGWSLSNQGGDKSSATWGGFDYWIIKIDSNGIKQWDKDYGGLMDDNLFEIISTKDNSFLISGYSSSNVSGNKSQPSWGGSDYWILKIDTVGNILWDRDYGGTLNEKLFCMSLTIDNCFILGGVSTSNISGNKTQPTWGLEDYWIVRLDSLGNLQWEKDYGGFSSEDRIENIIEIDSGFFIISGTSYSNISGDKSENNLGLEQSWLIKINSIGDKQWDKTIFTLGHDEASFVYEANNGCYTIINTTDANIGGYKTQASRGIYDYWLVNFCDSSLLSVNNIHSQVSNFKIYPNPTKNILSIQHPLFNITNCKIFNTLGKEILISTNQITKNKSETQLNISSLSSGFYLLRLTDEKGNFYSAKFVKE